MTFEDTTYAILEGDDGFQCYLTAALRLVKCGPEVLHQLLLDLDAVCCAAPGYESMNWEPRKPGDRVDSGMGGGKITEGVWIHPQLIEFGLESRILSVISGQTPRLQLPPEEAARLKERWAKREEISRYL